MQLPLRFLLFVAASLGWIGHAWAQAPDPSATHSRQPIEGYGLRPYRPAPPAPVAPEPPARKAAYAGLGLRSNPEGVVVVGVQPGPFGGDGSKSPSIWRGDLIVSMNGQSLDLAGYIRLIRSLSPGDTLEVVYRRGPSADPNAAVPRGDPNGEQHSVAVILDDAANWRGTLGRGLGSQRVIAPALAGEYEELLLSKAEALGLRRSPWRTGRAGCVSGFLAAAAAGSQLGARGGACARASALA